jgi:hypothetical protein
MNEFEIERPLTQEISHLLHIPVVIDIKPFGPGYHVLR